MRILVCASDAPLRPLDGLRLQIWHLCRELARRHEVCVLAYRWPDQSGEPPAGVELISLEAPSRRPIPRVAGWIRASLRPEPLPVVRMTPTMTEAVRELLADRDFDVAHVTAGTLTAVAPALGNIPAVLALLDAPDVWAQAETLMAKGVRRRAYRAHERRIRRYAAQAYRPYRRVVFVSPQDAEAVKQLDPTLRVAAVPNGVDLDYFRPNEGVDAQAGRIVFTGAMFAPHNVLAAEILARRILPLVRERRPDARLSLVGRGPHPTVRALDRLEGVEVTGEVPDVRPWLWRARAFACPMTSGTGIKNKLLEALACGTPSVATPLACQGIDVRDDEHVLVTEPGPAFAEALVRLLDDASLGARLSTAGRAYVAEHHRWEVAARGYERIYAEAIEEAR